VLVEALGEKAIWRRYIEGDRAGGVEPLRQIV